MAMATRAIPSFQTKSRRNLFANEGLDNEEPLEVKDSNEPTIGSEFPEEEDPAVNENENDNDDKENDTVVLSSDNDGTTTCGQALTLKIKTSPSKSISSKTSPRKKKTPSPRSPSGSIFSWLFGGFSGGSKKRRPPMKAKGIYYDSTTCDVRKESDRTLAIGENGEAEYVPDWIASNLEGHQRNVPVLVRRPEYDCYNEVDDKKLLKKVMIKARKLPQEPGKYASNHIMVNAARTIRNVPPLRRERYMDQIAREQAKMMAEERNLFHIETPRDLERRLKEMDMDSNELPVFTRMGINIGKGKTIAEIHRFMMAALAERNNIQDKRFSRMGMGTHHDKYGVLYMCQIYGG